MRWGSAAVVLLQPQEYRGADLTTGDIACISLKLAGRWIKARIAREATAEEAAYAVSTPALMVANVGQLAIEKAKAAERRQMAEAEAVKAAAKKQGASDDRVEPTAPGDDPEAGEKRGRGKRGGSAKLD